MNRWLNLLVLLMMLALVWTMLPGCGKKSEVTPSATPTSTSEPTLTPSPTVSPEPTPTATSTPTPSPSSTPSPSPTITPTPTTEPTAVPLSPSAEKLSGEIAVINPKQVASLAGIFAQSQEIDAAQEKGAISNQEAQGLEKDLKTKFSAWIRNRVDEIDPTDPDALQYFFWLQTIQATNKYDELATAATTQYKETQMGNEFNQWVRNRVDDLDPNDPDFLQELEKLRVLQLTDKYDKFIDSTTHAYKEGQIKEKFGQFITNLVDDLNPTLSTFAQDVEELNILQKSDIYDDLCPEDVKQYAESHLTTNIITFPGQTPHVVGILPQYGATNVPVTQPILIIFDQTMLTPSVEPQIRIAPRISFDITWLGDGVIAILQPSEPLERSTTYTLDIYAGARSIYDMTLAEDQRITFTTKGTDNPPQVTAVSPLDGQFDAPTGGPIEITFNQVMDPAAVESAISISPSVNYGVSWKDGNTVAVLQPFEPLDFDTTFTVGIGTGATSVDGLPMKESYNFSFFTGIHGKPAVLGSMPFDGQTGIPSNYPIQIVFDRPMDPASVEAALTISPAIEYTTSWYEANFILEIQPAAPLETGTTYTFAVGDGAISSFEQPLEKSFSSSFTTSQ